MSIQQRAIQENHPNERLARTFLYSSLYVNCCIKHTGKIYSSQQSRIKRNDWGPKSMTRHHLVFLLSDYLTWQRSHRQYFFTVFFFWTTLASNCHFCSHWEVFSIFLRSWHRPDNRYLTNGPLKLAIWSSSTRDFGWHWGFVPRMSRKISPPSLTYISRSIPLMMSWDDTGLFNMDLN